MRLYFLVTTIIILVSNVTHKISEYKIICVIEKQFIILWLIQSDVAPGAKRIHVKVDCRKFDEIFDELGSAAGISFVTDKYLRPTSDTDLDLRCPEILNAIVTLRLYNKRCQTSLTQQVMSVILKSRHVYYTAICRSRGSDSIKLRYEGIKCFQEVSRLNSYWFFFYFYNPLRQLTIPTLCILSPYNNNQSIDQRAKEEIKSVEAKTIVLLESLSKSNIESFTHKNLYFCCVYQGQKQYLRDAGIKTNCDKYIPNMLGYIDSYFAQLLDLTCPDLTNDQEDYCGKLKPLSVDGVKSHYRFMLNPVIRVMKTMDNNKL